MSKKDERYLGKVEYELVGANILKVSMDSTDFQGGDAKQGGETTISFEDIFDTHWEVEVGVGFRGNTKHKFGMKDDLKKVTLTFKGDEEMRNFYQAIVLIKNYLDEVLK